MNPQDIANRFTYHPPKPGQPEKYTEIRDTALAFATKINDLCPDSRESERADEARRSGHVGKRRDRAERCR